MSDANGGRLRRAADVVGASLLLLLAAPVMAVGAAAVLLGSGRPVFFGHERVGRGGRRFRCWKLRTMKVDAERELHAEPTLKRRYVENGYKLPNGSDPRVTGVGRWLRRSYVDELPQLFNVLNGTMSLLGPRPVVAEELEQFGDDAAVLLSQRPGIFGEWVSRGRTRPDYPERARIEVQYVKERSVKRDLRILLRSIPVVLRGQEDT